MCGVAGIFHDDRDHPVDQVVLTSMMDAVAHRGPDDSGAFFSSGVGLGHRRLSVIDLTGGHQPMTDPATGRTIVYNGEVYNYRQLRETRAKDLLGLSTDSDTEVVLRLARLDRIDWLAELNGMFALAIYDPLSDSVLLARDRFGVKPLYYSRTPSGVIFGSEIKALLVHPEVRARLKDGSVSEYLAFRSCVGTETFYKGILAVAPGHAIVLRRRGGQPVASAFWVERTPVEERNPGVGTHEDQCVAVFHDSIALRLIADVSVGAYASGGIDSTLVTWAMRDMASGPLHTFSVGFEEDAFDESRYSSMVASRLRTEHHKIIIDRKQYADLLPSTIWFNDEPLAHAHTPQLMELSRVAKSFVTVVLTGEGADEVFAGYPRHQIPILAKHLEAFPAPLLRGLNGLASVLGIRRMSKLLENTPFSQATLIHAARATSVDALAAIGVNAAQFPAREAVVQQAFANNRSLLEAVLYYDRRAYLPALLHRLDRTTMASGLEAREPFLDFNLVEWSRSLPASEKLLAGIQNKRILKRIARRILPRKAVYRRKVGFGVPVGAWLRDENSLGRYLDYLVDMTFKSRGYCNPTRVATMIDEHRAGKHDHGELLWSLLVFEMFLRMFIDPQSPQRPS